MLRFLSITNAKQQASITAFSIFPRISHLRPDALQFCFTDVRRHADSSIDVHGVTPVKQLGPVAEVS